MATSIVNNGLTGLFAAQAGVLTTSHNISNASTPGFSRQRIVQTTNQPMYTGVGFFGQGTNVQSVERMYSQYLSGRVFAAETRVGELDAYLAEIQQIDNMLADSSAGLSPALSEFFKGVQEVAANPSSIPARQSMLSTAEALVSRFQAIDQNLVQQRLGLNQQITSEIGLVNSYTSQIANLNQQIILAQAGGTNQPPNDLLDQREHLLQELNKEISVTTVTQTDGTLSVFIGNGQPVVMNTNAYALNAQPSSSDPQKVVVGIQTIAGNNTVELLGSFLTGGKLGGLLAFERESLNPAQNALGRIAVALAQSFNQQHQMGQDLNGAMGSDLFSFPLNSASGMFAYSNLYANKNNTGTAVLTAQILQSDYRVVYNGVSGQYDVYRLNANLPMASASGATPVALAPPLTPGGSVNVDGVTITAAAGALANGDAFTLKPGNPSSTRIVADSSNSAAGTASVLGSTQAGIGALSGSDYRLDYTGVGVPGYVVTRLSDNATLTPTLNLIPANSITFEGVTIRLQGAPNVGDSFILQPTRNAARDITVNFADPRMIAAGNSFRTRSDFANIGTASIDAGSMVALDPTKMPLGGSVTLTYTKATNTWAVAGAWTATIPSSDFTPGQQNVIDLNGIRFTISGVPQDGDRLYLDPNTNGVSDNRNAQALGGLQTTKLLAGNSASLEEVYSQIVSMIGNKTREIQVTGQAQQTLANEANDAVQQLSGVNLDEEAANLIRYQQAYQAAAKMIDVGTKLFDTFLAAVR
jgi:flagellar hook-associated protein 1 FlgK